MTDERTTKRGCVYRGLAADAAELGKRLKPWFDGGARAYFAVFRPDNRQLWQFDPAQAEALVATWGEGRVFSARIEVRWRRLTAALAGPQPGDSEKSEATKEQYALWLLAEEENLPTNLNEMQEIEIGPDGWQAVDRTDQARGIYLWGQYKVQEGAWIEVRLPWNLLYPVDDARKVENAFVRVGHLDYQAPNGAVQFVRLTEVM